MIEQAAASQVSELGLQQDRTTLLKPDQADVKRFNIEMQENFRTNLREQLELPRAQDVRIDHPDGDLLKVKNEDSGLLNPILKIDQSYKNILGQINDVPEVDTFLEFNGQKESKVRTNVDEKALPEVSTQELLDQMQEMRVSAAGFTREMSRWHTRMQMFSVNISVLTSLVSQASNGFKTLFRSSG